MCAQSIPELIFVVANETTIDITTAYVEVTETREITISTVLKIENLVGNTFLLRNVHTAKSLYSLALDDRTKDIAYVKIVYYLDAEMLDKRISQNLEDFHFFLKLPQSSYNPTTKVVTDIPLPHKIKYYYRSYADTCCYELK